jgi:alpha-tubulin suppressor-like RCC1 family protein
MLKNILILTISFLIFQITFSNKEVSANNQMNRISPTQNHTLILKDNGTVWAIGSNASGRLGDGTTVDKNVPVQVKGPSGVGFLTNIIKVETGDTHSYALKSDGTVWAWGPGDGGKLGDGKINVPSHTPVQVVGPGNIGFLTGIVDISGGYSHALALKSDGTVWAWGMNLYGETGENDSSTINYSPIQVKGPGNVGFLTNIVQITSGNFNSFALKNDGTVWSWGYNDKGRLGDGTTVNKTTPIQVVGKDGIGYLTNVKKISGGNYHTLTIKNDGTLWGWGTNTYGQLGNNTQVDSYTPVQTLGKDGISYLVNIEDIAAGGDHSVALLKNRTVLTWGTNIYGQLGDNTLVGKIIPVQVKGPAGVGILTDVFYIAAGQGNTIAMKRNGEIWGWGRNTKGQLDDGSSINKLSPVKSLNIKFYGIPIADTSVLINPGLLKIFSYPSIIEFENYIINLQNANVLLKSSFEISIDDFTGTWNGWKLQYKIDSPINVVDLKNSTITSSCLNSKIYDADNDGLKTGIGSLIENNFSCTDGIILYDTTFPLISSAANIETAGRHFFEFPKETFNLSFSNTSKAGFYSSTVTLQVFTGP